MIQVSYLFTTHPTDWHTADQRSSTGNGNASDQTTASQIEISSPLQLATTPHTQQSASVNYTITKLAKRWRNSRSLIKQNTTPTNTTILNKQTTHRPAVSLDMWVATTLQAQRAENGTVPSRWLERCTAQLNGTGQRLRATVAAAAVQCLAAFKLPALCCFIFGTCSCGLSFLSHVGMRSYA